MVIKKLKIIFTFIQKLVLKRTESKFYVVVVKFLAVILLLYCAHQNSLETGMYCSKMAYEGSKMLSWVQCHIFSAKKLSGDTKLRTNLISSCVFVLRAVQLARHFALHCTVGRKAVDVRVLLCEPCIDLVKV